MASAASGARQPPSEIRFLAELDQTGSGKAGFDAQKANRKSKTNTPWNDAAGMKEGIKISANLSSVRLFFSRLFGMTVNIEIGDKTYACGRSSLEHFLRRHANEANLQDKIGVNGNKGPLEYSDLAEGLKNLLANKDVQNTIRSEVVRGQQAKAPTDPKLRLYKDLANAEEIQQTVRVLGPYNKNFPLTVNQLRSLMQEAHVEPVFAPARGGQPPVPAPNQQPAIVVAPHAPIVSASVSEAAVPVAVAVATLASATVAIGANGQDKQEATDAVALANNDQEAVSALRHIVDDVVEAPAAAASPPKSPARQRPTPLIIPESTHAPFKSSRAQTPQPERSERRSHAEPISARDQSPRLPKAPPPSPQTPIQPQTAAPSPRPAALHIPENVDLTITNDVPTLVNKRNLIPDSPMDTPTPLVSPRAATPRTEPSTPIAATVVKPPSPKVAAQPAPVDERRQIAEQAAAKARLRQPVAIPERGLSESTRAEFRADRAREKLPIVNAETPLPIIEVSKEAQRAPSRPAPLRPQASQAASAPAPVVARPASPRAAAQPAAAAARSPIEQLEEAANNVQIDMDSFSYCTGNLQGILQNKQGAVYDRALNVVLLSPKKTEKKWHNNWAMQTIARGTEQLPHAAVVLRFKANIDHMTQQNAPFLNALKNIPQDQKPLLIRIAQEVFGKGTNTYNSFIQTLVGTKAW